MFQLKKILRKKEDSINKKKFYRRIKLKAHFKYTASHQHLTEDEIFKHLQKDQTGTNKELTFNTIKRFEKEKLIQKRYRRRTQNKLSANSAILYTTSNTQRGKSR